MKKKERELKAEVANFIYGFFLGSTDKKFTSNETEIILATLTEEEIGEIFKTAIDNGTLFGIIYSVNKDGTINKTIKKQEETSSNNNGWCKW